jgi:O-methyltransferase
MLSGIPRWIKRRSRELLYRLGYKVDRIPFTRREAYECINPTADYAPWNVDPVFREVYQRIEPATFVDKYRCYELWWLVAQSAKLASGALLEVGVWRGGTGAIIAAAARNCGLDAPVYLCDTFQGVVKAGEHDPVYRDGQHHDTSPELVKRLLADVVGGNSIRVVSGIFPEESPARLEQEKLRFCHIHVDVYRSAKEITEWLWEKLVVGGIVVYDDYGIQGCDGVTRFVEEMAGLDDRIVIANLNGHAVIVKIAQQMTETREQTDG